MPPPHRIKSVVGPLAFGHHLLCLGAQSLTRSQGREGYGSQPPRPRSLSPRQADPPPTSAALEAGAAPGRSTPRAQQGGRWARAIVTRPGQVPAQAGPPLPPPAVPHFQNRWPHSAGTPTPICPLQGTLRRGSPLELPQARVRATSMRWWADFTKILAFSLISPSALSPVRSEQATKTSLPR